jgi:hypothetical protein
MVIDDRPVVAYPGQPRMPVIDERVQDRRSAKERRPLTARRFDTLGALTDTDSRARGLKRRVPDGRCG